MTEEQARGILQAYLDANDDGPKLFINYFHDETDTHFLFNCLPFFPDENMPSGGYWLAVFKDNKLVLPLPR